MPVEAVPSGAWQQDEGIPLYRRLAKFAGRDLPESTIEGSWKLIGTSYENYTDDVMTLTFADGRVSLTSPCVPATAGTYRYEALVLEIENRRHVRPAAALALGHEPQGPGKRAVGRCTAECLVKRQSL